jgi:hypothetical protein
VNFVFDSSTEGELGRGCGDLNPHPGDAGGEYAGDRGSYGGDFTGEGVGSFAGTTVATRFRVVRAAGIQWF